MKVYCCLVLLAAFAAPSLGIAYLKAYRTLVRYCPVPFFPVGPECFYVNRAKKTWPDARAACQRIGGDLADPLNIYVFLEAIRDKHDTWAEKWFWVGGEIFSKNGDSSQWTWFSGRPVTEWETNQPDSREGEHCLMLRLYRDPPMYDYYCNKAYAFICEL